MIMMGSIYAAVSAAVTRNADHSNAIKIACALLHEYYSCVKSLCPVLSLKFSKKKSGGPKSVLNFPAATQQ